MKRLLALFILLSTAFGAVSQVPSVSVANNIATLTFTGTNIGSFQWYVQPTGQYIFGGSDYAPKLVTLKPATKYTFTVTAWAKDGTLPKSATVTYDPTIVVVPVKDTFQIMDIYNKGLPLVKIIVFTDGSVQSIKQ